MPLPIETPTDTTPTTLNATGINTVSGNPAGLEPGPHRIEKQSLTINYTRVPKGFGSFAASCVDLSGVNKNAMFYDHYKSNLVCEVKASYSITKDYGYYNTTGFQQPQQFKYYSLSADSYGNTYGTASQWNNGAACLGPMGTIETDKEWYQRKPWVEGTDVEISNTCDVRTYILSSTFFGTKDGASEVGQLFRWYIGEERALSFNGGAPGLYNFDDKKLCYQIFGEYNYTKESLREIANFIDYLGGDLRHERLYKPVATLPIGDGDVGLPQYRTSRHKH